MNHEKNVSTEQNSKKTPHRLPSPYENSRGTESDPTTTQSGSKIPRSLGFCKAQRLLHRNDFRRLQRGGRRSIGQYCCIDVGWGSSPLPRLGISVSSKYGNSPERNRFKRLMREVFRHSSTTLPKGVQIHVIPRQFSKQACLSDLSKDFLNLIRSYAEDERSRKILKG